MAALSPRHSKNSNVGCILSWSVKQTETTSSSVILPLVVPSHNMTMKLILTSLLHISCLKKYSAILLIKSLHPGLFSYDPD